jgi:prolyl 4-hydroxylase
VNDIPERDEYERLCRGEFDFDAKNDSKLYCYYKSDRPFLKLAPFKVEILRHGTFPHRLNKPMKKLMMCTYLEPMAVLFKNVVSDSEMQVVKTLATPRLNRATVQNAKTGQLEFANYRISKSAWLKEHEHEAIRRINNRIDQMTNLDQSTSEDLQVANYGIGGHYDPHFDFSRVRYL